ncbi:MULTISPECIES: DUF742 domain-containing protein [Streptomyces]|uniref:DUF742 domain-containing protein n=1 Tax=Streptomyces radicis TaxID=1750517 RepID=A0A3A9W4U7_9ACTN|nr:MULTISPECIES: DUF742 domain-containing protein [Streptomyces]RBM21363.1 DUF742 domain-containing protein [Streptomyces sp. PT12]RKN07899.1 DUF742 domain-containing protein [Streptomyces radicis]RKN20647.1 DUF742 domain-containing protein [Streptomyces radicis]
MNRRLIPPYVWTGGRTRPTRNVLDRLTVLRAAVETIPADVSPAEQRVLEILGDGALPLAEVAAHLSLPVSFVKVLASDLVDQGLLIVRAPAALILDEQPDTQLLERVIRGLRALQ